MTQELKGLEPILKMLGGGEGMDLKAFEARAKRSQMTWSAMQYATKSGCPCDACGFLRAVAEAEYQEAKKEAGISGNSNDSQPLTGAVVQPGGTAAGAGGGDLPVGAPPAGVSPTP